MAKLPTKVWAFTDGSVLRHFLSGILPGMSNIGRTVPHRRTDTCATPSFPNRAICQLFMLRFYFVTLVVFRLYTRYPHVRAAVIKHSRLSIKDVSNFVAYSACCSSCCPLVPKTFNPTKLSKPNVATLRQGTRGFLWSVTCDVLTR